MNKKNNKYVIGVDGGGTKTIAALADESGKIIKLAQTGSSSLRNIGVEKSVKSVAEAIRIVLSKRKNIKISSVFVGLPGMGEEFKNKASKIKKALLKEKIISQISPEKVTIGSDQLVAFRAGTEKKEGVVLIGGTGCVARGWKEKKDRKASGWGWLADEGSSFWIGQKTLQAVLKDSDGRGEKTALTNLVFKKFKIEKRNISLLNQKIYFKKDKDFITTISLLSIICGSAAKKGDKKARKILLEAGEELALGANTVIKKLELDKTKESFPLVLAGSLFKSETIVKKVKSEIKKTAPNAQLIVLKKEPVVGAVKIALESLTSFKR